MKLWIASNTLKGMLTHLAIVAIVFMLISLAFFYKMLPLIVNKDQVVSVPDVRGMTFEKAVAFLQGKELGYEVVDSVYASEGQASMIIEQFPKPLAKVKINRRINLTVNSRYPSFVSFPDLSGITFEFALRQLESLDLKVGNITYRTDFAHNTILESIVNGKTIQKGQNILRGSVIDLVVANANDKFVLPDLSGMPLDEVEIYLAATKLKLKKVHDVVDTTLESNIIQKHFPVPGDTVRHGDSIELWIYNLIN
jgi:eukaryotic-like serine/threonine-protein kinase